MSYTATLKDIEEAYALAREVAADFIVYLGYPTREEEEKAIANATPVQAIRALQAELSKARWPEVYADTQNKDRTPSSAK